MHAHMYHEGTTYQLQRIIMALLIPASNKVSTLLVLDKYTSAIPKIKKCYSNWAVPTGERTYHCCY